MWYGLKVDGEIVAVRWFPSAEELPTVRDFNHIFDDPSGVEVVRVEITEWKDRSYEFRQSGDNSWYQ